MRVLLIRLSSLGDVILATAAVKALAEDLPGAVAETAVDCRPCGGHGGKRCRRRHFRCMLDVSPGQVLAAVSEVLGGRA